MNIRQITLPLIVSILAILISGDFLHAIEMPATLAEAKEQAKVTGKPLLLVFSRSGCEYCAMAEEAAESDTTVKKALESVIPMILDINEGEGKDLRETYGVTNVFPVFVLANTDAETIYRWAGFSDPQRFVKALEFGMQDMQTIAERDAACRANPSLPGAQFLAKYYSDIRHYDDAIFFYQMAEKATDGRSDFDYLIYKEIVNAVWNDLKPISDALVSLDTILISNKLREKNKIDAIRLLVKLAIKKDRTDVLPPYLDAGIALTANGQTRAIKSYHLAFGADKILYVEADTTRAVEVYKQALPDGWQDHGDRFFSFAKWCLERKINLAEAEMYARRATEYNPTGPLGGDVYATTAQICAARGNYADALKFIKMAYTEYPDNEEYGQLWIEYEKQR